MVAMKLTDLSLSTFLMAMVGQAQLSVVGIRHMLYANKYAIANPEFGISKAVKIKERFAGYQQTMEELVQLA